MIAGAELYGYILLPTLAALAGGLLGEGVEISRKNLGITLHLATGVVLGVVGVELLPRTLGIGPPVLVIIAFVLGGFFFILVDRVSEIASSIGGGPRAAKRAEARAAENAGSHWVLAVGIGIDLFTDGLMVTVGYAISPDLALLLALGAVVVEIPEGFTTMAVLKEQAITRTTRLITLAILVATIPLGAVAGYVVAGQSMAWQVFVLAFTAGMLSTLMIEEMTPQSHECQEGRFATVAFILGFALFALLSVFFG